MSLFNCKLNRNITLNQPGDGSSGCEGQDISMGVGGLRSPILVYNISDVPSLKFKDDARADDSLEVDTINSTGQFYKIDFTSATYNEEYDPATHKWTHNLTLEIANITPLFEDLLADGVNGKYFVCFKPNGSTDYRAFGWKYGARLDYSLNISEDSLGYTVTLEDVSEYPLFTVYADNFGNNSKVYTPIFRPLWEAYFCEQDSNGKHTGYKIAMYVPKVNSAGQPLDRNNKLCQWSGNKQAAYKYNGIASDGGYDIIGTYGKNGVFDGQPVKEYDLESCPANVTNSIYINSKKVETINLNSTISAKTFTITSTDDWMMVTDPQYVTISPVEGENGNTQCSVHHNGVGGCESINFMNKETREIVVLNICVNLITVNSNYTFDCNQNEIVITPTVEGCSSAYTYTITPSITNSKDEYGYIHIYPTTSTTGTFILTLTHSCDSNEIKVVTIEIKCNDKNPIWQEQTSYCEMNDSGGYTNYRITIYIDINPHSPTFNTTKQTKAYDSTCSTDPATWQNIGSYCEVSSSGTNTGYYVTTYQDVNPTSPTYGNTREEKVYNTTQCPPVNDEPTWVLDGTFDPYCEQIIYEPSMLEGNSGKLIVRLIDENKYSPTFGQTKESGVTEDDWDATLQALYGDFPCETPNTDPEIDEITYTCELSANTEEMLVMTGWKISTGMDKNPYSPTYLSTTSAKTYDDVTCPPNNPHIDPTGCTAFIVDGGSISADATGDTGCDSAFLYEEGTPVFTPSSASSWVTINYYHWDTDPASDMCTNYALAPCVANNLMWQAGIVADSADCRTATSLSDYPQVVQDAVNKTGKYAHALGTIEYVISSNSGEARECTINFIVDSTECPSKEYRISQAGSTPQPTGTCDCSSYDVRGLGVTVSSAASSTEYTVARYTGATNCSEPFTFSLKYGDNFMGNFRASGGYVYAKCIESNPGNTRQSQYYMKQGDCSGTIYINQQKKYVPPAEDGFRWEMSGHETNYSATTSMNYLDLSQFYSVLNGEYVNGVISANVNWITTNSVMYVNNNEMTPTTNNILYFTDYNYGSSARVGRLTLTQKGTSNKITCDIIQTVKPIDCTVSSVTLADDVVCSGSSLNFTYTMVDSRCTTKPKFNVRDGAYNWHEITASTISSGTGTGVINTSGYATGASFIQAENVARINNFTISACTTPSPTADTWTISVNARNITASETVYVNGFELHMSGGSILTYTQSQKIQLVPGAMSSFNQKTFQGSASVGETIDAAAMLVSASSSGGDAPQSILCTITPTTLQDGNTYEIRYNGGLSRSLAVEEEDDEKTEEDESSEDMR